MYNIYKRMNILNTKRALKSVSITTIKHMEDSPKRKYEYILLYTRYKHPSRGFYSLKMFRKIMNEIKQIWLLLRAPMHAPWIPKSSSNGQVGMSFGTSWPLRASRSS